MRINLRLRLKNKTTLITLLITLTAAVYKILEILGVTPKVNEKDLESLIYVVVGLLASLGIIVDPTTKGVSDSDRAMTYASPSDANLDLSVVDNAIDDDNETVKTEEPKEPKEDKTYIASDLDAVKDLKGGDSNGEN